MGSEFGCSHWYISILGRKLIVRQGDVFDFDVFKGPFVEEFNGAITDNIGWEKGELSGSLFANYTQTSAFNVSMIDNSSISNIPSDMVEFNLKGIQGPLLVVVVLVVVVELVD